MFPEGRLEDEMNWFSKNQIEFIFCCDANFGMFPRDRYCSYDWNCQAKDRLPTCTFRQNTKSNLDRSYETQKFFVTMD